MQAAKTYSQLKKDKGLTCTQDRRPSAARRGYGPRWQRASKQFRKENPLCAECGRYGITRQADCVDHIVPHKGDMKLFWDRSNWESLCFNCHNRKTAKEDGGFSNPIDVFVEKY